MLTVLHRPEPKPLEYYLPPSLGWMARDGGEQALLLAHTFGPQADMQGLVDSVGDAGQAFSEGNYVKAAADLGIAALSPLGLKRCGGVR